MVEGGGEKSRTFCVHVYVVCIGRLTHCIKNLNASGLSGQPPSAFTVRDAPEEACRTGGQNAHTAPVSIRNSLGD